MTEIQNKTLRLNTFPLSNRRYFDQLKGHDKRKLTEVLCILRDNGIKEITELKRLGLWVDIRNY